MIYLAFGKRYTGNVYAGPWRRFAVSPKAERGGVVTEGKPPFYEITLEVTGEGRQLRQNRIEYGTLTFEKLLKRVSPKRGGSSKRKSHRNLLSNAQNGYKPRCLVTREQLITLLENNHVEA